VITADERLKQSQQALLTLLFATGFGLTGILIYAVQSTEWRGFFAIASTGILVGVASFFVGALLGFLFGIPRTLQRSNTTASTSTTNTSSASAGSTNGATEFQANTNLEQISDWLTKILVGVGLTQVNNILTKLSDISGSVAAALGSTSGNRSFALALIIFFLIVGFFFAYLWTRLHLAMLLTAADNAIRQLQETVDEVSLKVKDVQANALGTGKSGTIEVDKKLLEVTNGIQPGDPNDPWKGRFGGNNANNDRELTAQVSPIAGRAGLYAIQLLVKSLHADTNPLKGAVQFFLHPTFNDETPVVSVGPNGTAELSLKAWGAFTVGAVADDGATKLELDLSQLASAPADFKSR